MTAAAAASKGPKLLGEDVAGTLLAWYSEHCRDLPWRISPADLAKGARPDPYRVWLSEIMLQQTTVEAVKPYFRKFVRQWPDVAALAAATDEDIMKAWAGLGYYTRARNLKKCASRVAALPGRDVDLGKVVEHGPIVPRYNCVAASTECVTPCSGWRRGIDLGVGGDGG